MRMTTLAAAFAFLFLASACETETQIVPKYGYVGLTRGDTGSWGWGLFSETVPPRNCTTSTMGSCEVQECLLTSAGATVPLDSAGVVTANGANLGPGYAMTAGPATYQAPGGAGDVWAGGETISVSATGGSVPAFSNVNVTAPTPIVLTAPACAIGQPACALSRHVGLPISWTGGANTSVVAVMTGSTGLKTLIATCRFQGSPGEIGADVLEKLEPSSWMSLQVYGSNLTQFTSGDYDITLEARNWEYVHFPRVID